MMESKSQQSSRVNESKIPKILSNYARTTDSIFSEFHNTDRKVVNGMPIHATCTLTQENRRTDPIEYSPVVKAPMTLSAEGNILTYMIGGRKCHYLNSMSMKTKTPSIRVKPEYEKTIKIRQTSHFLFNQLKEMQFKIPIQLKPTHNNNTLIAWYNFYNKDKTQELDYMIGAEEPVWGTEIKARTFKTVLPFFIYPPYSKPISLLKFGGHECLVRMEAEYVKSYYELISMIEFDEEKRVWTYVKPDQMKQYLEPFDDVVKPWGIYCSYLQLSKEAFDRLESGCENEMEMVLYSLKTLSQDNTANAGEHISLHIPEQYPYYGLMWFVENIHLKSYGSHSVFTQRSLNTETYDRITNFYMKKNLTRSVRNVSLIHEKGEYFKNVDEDYFDSIAPINCHAYLPKDEGIYIYQVGSSLLTQNLESPLNELFKNIQLKVELNPFVQEDHKIVEPSATSNGSHENKYKLRCVVLTRTIVKFIWDDAKGCYTVDSDEF